MIVSASSTIAIIFLIALDSAPLMPGKSEIALSTSSK
jgi:membrane protein YqaA with SNARE-associated domain